MRPSRQLQLAAAPVIYLHAGAMNVVKNIHLPAAAKRDIVGKLAVMHDKEATDYMMEILNK